MNPQSLSLSLSLAYGDMPALLKDLREIDAVSAKCLYFTILTVARTKESTARRWPDIDFAARTRAVQILKGRRAWQHLVPLSEQAVELLRNLLIDSKPEGEYVFPARNRRGHLGTSAMRDLPERMGWNDRTTTHGIRAAFKT